MSELSELKVKLKKCDIEIEPEWNCDVIRNEAQWFVGKRWEFNDKTFYRCWFGDYRRDIREEWKSYEKLNKKEAEQADVQSQEIIQKEAEHTKQLQIEAKVKCQAEWEYFAVEGRTSYMDKKKIKELYGARIKQQDSGHILVVPLRDTEGVLWNFQRIYAQKLSRGDKFFAEGALVDGCFHILGDTDGTAINAKSPTNIYVCEGFATASSVNEALGAESFVVTAFNAGNIGPVVNGLKQKFPNAKITVCADNDAHTKIKRNGVEIFYNVGIEKGRRAAGNVGGELVYPIFQYPQKGLTDFNDLAAVEGLDRVQDQILNFGNYVKGIQPMCLQTTLRGKIIEPTEKEVCEYLLRWFGAKIVRQEKSLFIYCGTHWKELNSVGIDNIKQMIQIAANGLLGSRELNSYFNYFMIHAPSVPEGVDLFQPNPFVANFQNGTLHIWRTKEGKTLSEFRKHDSQDFLTSVLPFAKPSWEPSQSLPPAPQLDAMTESMWGLNSDKEEVKLLAYELVGAALCPAYPIIVIFHGKPNSGKSTFIKLVVKLVNKENICSVQLCDMHGFNMESMIGKLLNFDTDIDVNKPMNDSEVKKLIDRVPRRIRRKGIADVYAHLPALHLFAANRLPKSLDGSSHAYGRRLILVKTESLTLPGRRVLDFEQRILDDELPGIIARGLQGLYRLMANDGLYTVPETSIEAVKALEMDSDVVGLFLEDIKTGEVFAEKAHKIFLEEGAEIEPNQLWPVFTKWFQDTHPGRKSPKKHEFYAQVEAKGFSKRIKKGYPFFRGIGFKSEKNPIA